jgi:hypothetical protein
MMSTLCPTKKFEWIIAPLRCRQVQICVLSVLIFSTGGANHAQTIGGVEGLPMAGAAVTPDILPAESLGPGDLLQIMVSYCPEFTRSFRISSGGTLSLPLLHEQLLTSR